MVFFLFHFIYFLLPRFEINYFFKGGKKASYNIIRLYVSLDYHLEKESYRYLSKQLLPILIMTFCGGEKNCQGSFRLTLSTRRRSLPSRKKLLFHLINFFPTIRDKILETLKSYNWLTIGRVIYFGPRPPHHLSNIYIALKGGGGLSCRLITGL